MIKSLIKSIVTGERLAGYAADGIQKGINGTKEEVKTAVAKYATIAKETSILSQNISAMLTDGKIDDMEREQVKALLAPLFNKVLEMI